MLSYPGVHGCRLAVLFATEILLLLFVSACGASVPPTPSLVPAGQTQSAVPSDLPPPPSDLPPPPSDLPPPPSDLPPPRTGSAPDGSPSAPELTLPHADPDLEAQLPTELDGIALVVYSLAASDFMISTNEESFTAFLDQLGRSPSDVTIAVAVDFADRVTGSLTALRVMGADSDDVVSAFIDNEQAQASAPLTVTPLTLGNRSVVEVTSSQGTAVAQYLYTRGDVVFVVEGTEQTGAGQFLAALP